MSTAWYTWLEQGRGGAPSADVLDRLARALLLNDAEREHLFLIGVGHLPEVRYHAADHVSPRVQHVLDSLDAARRSCARRRGTSSRGTTRQPRR